MAKCSRSGVLGPSLGETKPKPSRSQPTAKKAGTRSGQKPNAPAMPPAARTTCTRSSAASAQTEATAAASVTGAESPRAPLQPTHLNRKRTRSAVDAEEADAAADGRPGKENKRQARQVCGQRARGPLPSSPPSKPPSPVKASAPAPAPAPAVHNARGIEARQSGVGAVGTPAPVLPVTADESFQPQDREHVAMVLDVLLDASASEERRNSTSSSSSSAGRDISTSTAQQSGTPLEPAAAAAPHGRQQHFLQLHSMLSQCQREGLGRSVYISGLPGTGKSHTVHTVLSSLKEQNTQPTHTVFLSCFGLHDPSEVHRALYLECEQALSGPHAAAASSSPQDAHQQLVRLLQACSKPQKSDTKKKKNRMFVLVLDEVDRLLLKGTDDLHKLFMLPHIPGVCCCVIAMANSIDITERSLPALRCRGCAPDFIPFTTYSRPQVLSILNSKLARLPWPVFHDQALELVARKVCSSSGDLRKVFQACRFALTSLHEKVLQDAERSSAEPANSTHRQEHQQPQPEQPQPSNQEQGLSQQQRGQPSMAGTLVGVSQMAAALSRLSYQAGSGASHASTIRCLPQQQQLHLLALATNVATVATQAAAATAAEAAAQEHGLTASAYRTKYYWGPSVPGPKAAKASNPFAADPHRSTATTSKASAGDSQRSTAAASKPGSSASASGSDVQGQISVQGQSTQGQQVQQVGGLSHGRQQQGSAECSGVSSITRGPQSLAGSGNQARGSGGESSAGRRSSAGSFAELCTGDAACSVLLRDTYEQYRRLALQTFQHPASEQEFKSTMQLLSQTGLVSMHPASDSGAKRTILTEQRCTGKVKQGDVSLGLKVQMKDIHTALRDSVLFKRVLAGLPHT